MGQYYKGSKNQRVGSVSAVEICHNGIYHIDEGNDTWN